ncbi:unnamed protein product [Linum tenue]|uniref:Uncharacterized protein n=1 Tax=Linum tenue TaxID=586396 RepID=A0AAV0R0C9_9ROSI|nr:unnamed protein product [Linum tenue]
MTMVTMVSWRREKYDDGERTAAVTLVTEVNDGGMGEKQTGWLNQNGLTDRVGVWIIGLLLGLKDGFCFSFFS